MKRIIKLYVVVLISFIFSLPACAPRGATTVPPTSPPPATPAATTVGPVKEQTAWAKVEAAAKKEGLVTLYNFDFTGDVGTTISQGFQRRYGIKAEMIAGAGAILAERIRAEQTAKKNVADIFSTAPSLMLITQNEGRTESWGTLPVLAEKDAWPDDLKADPLGHMLTFSRSLTIPYVNTNLVKQGQEPKSYKDFLDPRWKGKITISSPTLLPQFNYLYLAGKRHGFLDDNYFRQLAKQDLKVVANVRDSQLAVVRGEAAIALPASDGVMGRSVADGAPVKAIEMQEGAVETDRSAVMLLKDAPHPNAARVFTNWLFSQEGQTIFHKLNATNSPRKDVFDFRPQKL